MSSRIGVDIGGTFTDFIVYDELGDKVIIDKIPTTPESPEKAVIEVIKRNLNKEELEKVDFFLHGTTVGLNSLLERKGSKVGLLCTKGFRDILEIRRGDRDEMYNLFWQPAPPLVPRFLRLEIDERLYADGSINKKINTDEIKSASKKFIEEGVNSVAIAFINSYTNKDHELEASKILIESGFNGQISLSSMVSGEYREYERTTTTVIDAFVKARMSNYLNTLKQSLNDLGYKGSFLVTRSGSGSMTFDEAEDRPFETIMSGPVAGAEGAGELSRKLNNTNMVTADVGGTSFDTCLIIDGRPQIQFEGKIVGLPVQSPWVDVRSIGAGGGSIAYLDEGGLIRSGPQSSGALPGPACYDRGGKEPTTTDAAFYLGMLGEGKLASGLQLNKSLAEKALNSVGEKIKLSAFKTAKGILQISSANMADAIREITIEQGIDPRELKLLAFGGAGPLMSNLIAQELDIKEIIIPPYSGNFSAWGLLGADLLQMNAKTKILRLSEESIKDCNVILDELFEELQKRQKIDFDTSNQIKDIALDMRWMGQEHTITLKLDSEKDGKINLKAEEIKNLFMKEYQRTFGSKLDTIIEIVSTRASLRVPLPRKSETGNIKEENIEISKDKIQCFSFNKNEIIDFEIISRSNIDSNFTGPKIIVESTAITYVDVNYDVRKDANNNLILINKDMK
ncbi:MAG: Acetophenone carboxylase gamma subunit [Alphaproteobacteria bacterium MarineAlpha5_Bin5]|nr:MAG: Acetophenone carboxylase gamma subunit [Alphaproteobacteria bacterium MarineAlpha5_Bin5]PPR52789.1 MAG: Acetophenone carboxylase gamma subunit [Alphaproteobacteria bacterium MarineAlpha5_Bin4]|tara:strand:- start:7516 stop:9555 length:2040 start_codon:yes stop_codon:yes gene_type:complete